MNRPRKRYIVIGVLVVLVGIAVPAYRWVFPPAHQHCMKQTIFIFLQYANENGRRYPESERGWGDALLKLGSADQTDSWIPYIVGIDDDGSHLIEALERGTDVNEARCTRVYVQGLSEDSIHRTAILFDRDSEPGGDHFRGRFRESLREVLTAGGSHEMIKDCDWPDYVEKQKQLLRDQGFDEARINKVYGQYKWRRTSQWWQRRTTPLVRFALDALFPAFHTSNVRPTPVPLAPQRQFLRSLYRHQSTQHAD